MDKKCSKCGETKDVSEFCKDAHTRDGFNYRCKVCRKAYRQTPSQKVYQEAYKQTPEYKASQKVYQQSPEKKAYDQSPERKAFKKAYQQSPKGKSAGRKANRKRRALKAQVKEEFTAEQETFVREAFNHCCFNCKSTQRLEIDHNLPLSKGHALTISNAVLLCKHCNTSKNNNSPSSFYSTDKLWVLGLLLFRNEVMYRYHTKQKQLDTVKI